jgi:hypothetical protein
MAGPRSADLSSLAWAQPPLVGIARRTSRTSDHPSSPAERSGAMFLWCRGCSTPAEMLCADRAPTESSGTRRPRTPCTRVFSKRSQTHPKQRQPPAPEAFTTATPRRTAGRHAFLPNEPKLIRNSRNCRPQRQLRRLPRAEPPADMPLCRVPPFLLRQPKDREVILIPVPRSVCRFTSRELQFARPPLRAGRRIGHDPIGMNKLEPV